MERVRGQQHGRPSSRISAAPKEQCGVVCEDDGGLLGLLLEQDEARQAVLWGEASFRSSRASQELAAAPPQGADGLLAWREDERAAGLHLYERREVEGRQQQAPRRLIR